jgi:hypothetical protein
VTPLTPSYAHVVLPCSCDSPMLMRFFMRRTRGDYESVLSQEDDPEKIAGIQNDVNRLN